jgi:uncharacterized protein
MKAISTTLKACTLSLILFAGSACAPGETLSQSNATQPQAKQIQGQEVQAQEVTNTIIAANIATNAYKPGINRVIFQSKGEKIVGNLYLPANYKAGDKLPMVIVTGAWNRSS